MMAVSVADGAPAVSGALVDTDVTATGATNFSFSGMAFGAAAADRWLVAVITFTTDLSRTINSVTIGGVAATLVKHQETDSGFTDDLHAAIYKANVPAGTSGTVAVNLSGTSGPGNGMHVALYRLTGISTQVVGGAQNTSISLAVQAGDFLVAGGVDISSPSGGSCTGVVEAWDVAENDARHVGGAYSAAATGNHTVNITTSGGSSGVTFAAAAFRA